MTSLRQKSHHDAMLVAKGEGVVRRTVTNAPVIGYLTQSISVQIPIGHRLSEPRSSIPRFPPFWIVQRLPTGFAEIIARLRVRAGIAQALTK